MSKYFGILKFDIKFCQTKIDFDYFELSTTAFTSAFIESNFPNEYTLQLAKLQ